MTRCPHCELPLRPLGDDIAHCPRCDYWTGLTARPVTALEVVAARERYVASGGEIHRLPYRGDCFPMEMPHAASSARA